MNEKKFIIITGASSDMGYALAKQLVNEYNLLLVDMDYNKLSIIKDKLINNTNSDVFILSIDFTDINNIGIILKNF